jgi:hypothetical protein
MPSKYKTIEQPLVVNIGGATAENHADAENTATNINILEAGTGQSINIDQTAKAIVNNITAIIIGSPYPVNFDINENNKTLNIDVKENGEIKLNGETMKIKTLKNGMKVIFLHDSNEDTIVNNKEEKNIEMDEIIKE